MDTKVLVRGVARKPGWKEANFHVSFTPRWGGGDGRGGQDVDTHTGTGERACQKTRLERGKLSGQFYDSVVSRELPHWRGRAPGTKALTPTCTPTACLKVRGSHSKLERLT